MKIWSKIYTKHGLLEMIERNEKQISEKAIDYVYPEDRHNPLMAEGVRKELKEDMDVMRQQIKEWKEAILEIEERDGSKNQTFKKQSGFITINEEGLISVDFKDGAHIRDKDPNGVKTFLDLELKRLAVEAEKDKKKKEKVIQCAIKIFNENKHSKEDVCSVEEALILSMKEHGVETIHHNEHIDWLREIYEKC